MPELDNNALLERLEGVTKLINEKFEHNAEQHNDILTQTKKTNGRVTDLESWKNKVIGALVMTNIIILPVMFMIISSWFNRK
jgi:hypothetical protein